MIQRRIVFLILLLSCLASALQAQKILNLVLIQREGLPNFANQLISKNTDSLTIAFIGGSITEAKDVYRNQTIAWLQQKYPQKLIKQIMLALAVQAHHLEFTELTNRLCSTGLICYLLSWP